MKQYTVGKKAAVIVIHQLCMILMITGIFTMGSKVRSNAAPSGIYGMMAVLGLVGSLVTLAYLTNMTGQYSEDDKEIHYHVIDRVPSDVILLLFILLVIASFHISMELRHEEFPLAGLLITAGTLTYLLDLAFLLFYMSIMRRLKGSILLTGSISYRAAVWLWQFFRKHGDGLPRTQSARERILILNALEAIADGELDIHLDEKGFHGQTREMAAVVNHIRDGMKEAVNRSIRNERLKADLITNVSHDIKTPLTSIVNYVELLKREDFDNPAARNYIRIIDEKSQRLKQLMEDLVEASRISFGNVKMDMQNIDFVELLYQAGGEFNERFEQRQLTIVTKLPRDAVIICADGRQLYRVVENLYTNAAKYALEKSRIHVELTVEGEDAAFSMKNICKDPIQIGSGKYEDLTERFVRGELSRTTEGSGLGLSIAKNLTILMGGRFSIQVEDDLFIAKLFFPLSIFP